MKNRFKALKYIILACAVFAMGTWGMYKYQHRFSPLTSTPTLLMVFSDEYASAAANSLASIKENAPELLPNITICVSDEGTKKFALDNHLQYFELNTINAANSDSSIPMNIMGHRKIECILHVLQRNEDVFYFDTDIVFFQNPLHEFNNYFDINLQGDECKQSHKNSYLCTGFMYIKSNPKTINLMHEIVDSVVTNEYAIHDQNAFDNLVQDKDLLSWYNFTGPSINVLDACKFPNGCRYFDKSDHSCKPEDALIVHNNHINGLKNKRARFEKFGLIFAQNAAEAKKQELLKHSKNLK